MATSRLKRFQRFGLMGVFNGSGVNSTNYKEILMGISPDDHQDYLDLVKKIKCVLHEDGASLRTSSTAMLTIIIAEFQQIGMDKAIFLDLCSVCWNSMQEKGNET